MSMQNVDYYSTLTAFASYIDSPNLTKKKKRLRDRYYHTYDVHTCREQSFVLFISMNVK